MKAWAKAGRILLSAVMAAVMISFPLPARAAGPFVVNSTNDLPDANPGDGLCAAANDTCTLRAAIMEANALAGPDTITLAAGTYTLAIHGAAENGSATGDLDITSDLTITGAGSASTVVTGDATWDDRIMQMVSFPTIGAVSISGLTMKGGHTPAGENGGGLEGSAGTVTLNDLVFTDNTADLEGGGAWVGGNTIAGGPGTVTLDGIAATNNTAGNVAGGLSVTGNGVLSRIAVSNNTSGRDGGGIHLSGTGTLTNFTVAGNHSGSPGSSGIGGGIVADSSSAQAPWLISNGTVSGNHSEGQGGGLATANVTLEDVLVDNNSAAIGGGISNVGGNVTLRRITVSDNTGTLTQFGFGAGVHDQGRGFEMENVTITQNHGGGFDSNSFGGRLANVTIADNDSGYGIVVFNGTPITLQGVILTGNSPANCSDPTHQLVSLGGNLENGNSCPAEIRADPMLAPLADNGGPVPTRALLPGSPAIDAMPTGICPPPATDERGVARPQGSACDIGAFEFSAETIPPSCGLTAVLPGPPKQVKITVQDLDSGLQSITVTKNVNATVDVPAFTPGTKAPVVVTGTKTDQTKGAQVGLRATDVAGNVTNCDPELLTIKPGDVQRIRDVPRSEHRLTLSNGSPGLRILRVTVNRKTFELGHLRSGEVRVLDISSAMVAGSHNTVTLQGYGRRGSSAEVVLSE